jgi:hypothetical protein
MFRSGATRQIFSFINMYFLYLIDIKKLKDLREE